MKNQPIQTSNSTATFSYYFCEGKFDWDSSQPHFTQGKISDEEIHQVLHELAEMQKPFTKQAAILVLFHSLSLIFIMLGFIFYEASNTRKDKAFFYLRVAGFFLLFCFVVLTMVYQARKQNGKIRAVCQDIIDKSNPKFMKQGFKWCLPDYFPKSIQLCKNYQNQDMRSSNQESSSSQEAINKDNLTYIPPSLI